VPKIKERIAKKKIKKLLTEKIVGNNKKTLTDYLTREFTSASSTIKWAKLRHNLSSFLFSFPLLLSSFLFLFPYFSFLFWGTGGCVREDKAEHKAARLG